MLNMKYCRTENVIAALREWEDEPGTDEHLHHELYKLCSRIAADDYRKCPQHSQGARGFDTLPDDYETGDY